MVATIPLNDIEISLSSLSRLSLEIIISKPITPSDGEMFFIDVPFSLLRNQQLQFLVHRPYHKITSIIRNEWESFFITISYSA